MSLGDKIRVLRKNKNWSQAQLADKLNLHAKHISRYELDNCKPSFEVLRKMGELFGVTTDYLLAEEPESDNPETPPVLRDRELLAYIEKIEQLDDEDRKLAKDMLEAVLARNQIKKLKNGF
ncbi:MAG: helix-turn-helix transcriptional regulator [Firmicutes bacterium]|nr:helix-turn-helix transcriptional regulator [Bacillota bacterium]